MTTIGAASAAQPLEERTMGGMAHAPGPAHARKVASPRDHLWVPAVIAAFALYDVWKAWSDLGSKSGFGHAGWTLTVIVEVYLLYSLFAWLGGAAGPRSRKFAMWSAGFVLILSLIGQASSRVNAHRIPPVAVVVFVSVLPVIGLMLIAFLVHFRQIDRAEATQTAETDVAEAATVLLRGEMEALRQTAQADREALMSELEAARSDRESAHRELAEALTRAEALAKKLAAKTAREKRERQGASAHAEDLTTELRALKLLEDEPDLRKPRMGGELARRLNVSAATGRRLHARLTAQDGTAEPLGERSPRQPDVRSGERS